MVELIYVESVGLKVLALKRRSALQLPHFLTDVPSNLAFLPTYTSAPASSDLRTFLRGYKGKMDVPSTVDFLTDSGRVKVSQPAAGVEYKGQ